MNNRDYIIEEVWNSRKTLLEQHGGIEGFIKFIKDQESQHSELLVTPEQVKEKKTKDVAM